MNEKFTKIYEKSKLSISLDQNAILFLVYVQVEVY